MALPPPVVDSPAARIARTTSLVREALMSLAAVGELHQRADVPEDIVALYELARASVSALA